MKFGFTVFLVSFIHLLSLAQAPVASFTLAGSACLNESLKTDNTSIGAARYEWDLCQGDLSLTPTAQIAGITAGNTVVGIDIVYDGQKWFGFLASRETNSIVRLDFGTDITSSPTSFDLGNVSGVLGRPIDVKIVKEGAEWYGFVYSEGFTASDTQIARIKFGSSLENTTSTSTVITADIVLNGSGSGNAGFDLVRDGTNWIIVYTLSNTVGLVRLASLNAIPAPADLLVTGIIADANFFGDIKIVSSNGQWYAYAVAWGNQTLHRFSFGTNLFSIPTSANITGSLIGALTPYGVEAGFDDGNYYLLISTIEGSLIRINLGGTLSSAPVGGASLGNFAVMATTVKLKMFKYHTQWYAFSIAYIAKELYRISFPSPACNAIPGFSETAEPIIRFSTPGQKFVTLRGFDVGNNFSEVSHGVTVNSTPAPDIDFQSQNVCAVAPVNFSAQSPQVPTGFNWDFGNGNTSTQAAPAETFATAGVYDVGLIASFSNGCTNYAAKPITIYNAPVAAFGLPAASPVCTNQPYPLANSSTFDAGSTPSWEWTLNGSLFSSQQEATVLINSATSNDITLKVLLPGCENEMTRNIPTVLAGPLVNFDVSDGCLGTTTAFTNTTSGTVTGYSWNFGDGGNAVAVNPSHTYAAAGIYPVVLTTTNGAGCENFQQKSVQIYSLPQPDFSVGLPPFSCARSVTPFQNNTPALTDSNITSWSWSFGDPAGGNSNEQNPSYTYATAANFNVILRAFTNAGCSNAITKVTVISSSPSADFAAGPACLGQPTQFTDLSSGGIQSRIWQIGTGTFTSPNPAYVFNSSGPSSVSLSVTSANNCSNVKATTLNLPVPPTVNFTVANPCAGKNALFTDVTSSPQDAAAGWNWLFDGNSVAGNPAEYNFTPAGTHSAKLTTTHASGCKYSLTKSITINPSPAASFTAAPDRGAAPLTVQFLNASQNASTYTWRFYDKVPATSTQVSPAYTFTSLGDYSAELTATSSQGCSDVLTVPILVLVPSVDMIMQDFTLGVDAVSGKLKPTVTILNNSNVPVSSAEIELFLADKAVVNETVALDLGPGQSATRSLSFTLAPTQFDFAFLCAEIASGKDVQKDNNKKCVNLGTEDHIFSPYPNPTEGTVQLDWISQSAGTARIAVYDSKGGVLYEWETPSKSGLNQSRHDLSFLTAGLYFITVETATGRSTMRFMRQ